MGTIHYNNRKLRIIAALAAGSYMVIHGTRFDLQRALKSPMFYVVVAVSCMAALLLVEFVHFVTKRLDVNYDWRSKFTERLVFQILFAVMLLLLMDAILFSVYFGIQGQSIFENRFFHADLPMVLILLVVLSGYYYIYYLRLTDKRTVCGKKSKGDNGYL